MRQLIRRISFYLVTLWISITLNFLIPRLAPGNPAQAYLARMRGRVPPSALRSIEIAFGVSHDSFWSQYLHYLNNLFHGDFGISITYFPTRVIDVIQETMGWTLVLLGISLIISFVIGTILGVFAAWWRGSLMDTTLTPTFTFIQNIPYFFLALTLLYLLAFKLHWFPLNGGYDVTTTAPGWNLDFLLSAAQHALLPAITIILTSLGGWILLMRNTMISTLTEDYVLFAEAKGLPRWLVMFNYAARNAVLPTFTNFALSLSGIVGGQILVEVVFSYPGIGFGFFQAVTNLDYPLLEGLFLITTIAVLVANFLADLFYVVLDPRVRN